MDLEEAGPNPNVLRSRVASQPVGSLLITIPNPTEVGRIASLGTIS